MFGCIYEYSSLVYLKQSLIQLSISLEIDFPLAKYRRTCKSIVDVLVSQEANHQLTFVTFQKLNNLISQVRKLDTSTTTDSGRVY